MILKDKIALVTGTSRGIGKEIVKRFAEEGCSVYAHARKENESHSLFCSELSLKYKVNVKPIYFEATDYNEIYKSLNDIKDDIQNIDILVNNLSTIVNTHIFQFAKIDDLKLEFDVNFFSPLYLTQYISRFMSKQRKGSIINLSSVAGIDGNTGMIGYVSCKAAIIGATKRLAIELGDFNIRVNSVAPGITNTDMGNMMGKDLSKLTLNHQVFNHMASTNDIADAVLFFASDLSKHITGQVLRVDGGMLK